MSRLPISALILSPPETELLGSFDCPAKMDAARGRTPLAADPTMSEPAAAAAPSPKADPARQRPLSPPESPAALPHERQRPRCESLLRPSFASVGGDGGIVDPAVVPADTHTHSHSHSQTHEPMLFPPIKEDPVEAAIQQHIQANAHHFVRGKSRGDKRTLRYQLPSIDDYRLAVAFVSTLGKADAQRAARRVHDENAYAYPQAKRLGARPNSTASPPSSITLAPLAVRTPAARHGAAPARVVKATSPRKTSAPRARPRSGDGEAAAARAGRQGTPHQRHREPKKPIDMNWRALPDYAPSTAILEDNARALRVDWDGNPLDLSADPDRHELHEAELHLASALRLTCARYLTCKRRIFASRVDALRIGKEFKKTDAQQACQIDVNKASKLWLAYDRVGWLQPQLFKEYL